MFHLFFHMKISVVNTASMAIYELIYTDIIYPITGFIITYMGRMHIRDLCISNANRNTRNKAN